MQDRGHIIFSKLRNNKAVFVTARFDGTVFYIAANRAARRFIRSNKVKHLGLDIDLETNSIS